MTMQAPTALDPHDSESRFVFLSRTKQLPSAEAQKAPAFVAGMSDVWSSASRTWGAPAMPIGKCPSCGHVIYPSATSGAGPAAPPPPAATPAPAAPPRPPTAAAALSLPASPADILRAAREPAPSA